MAERRRSGTPGCGLARHRRRRGLLVDVLSITFGDLEHEEVSEFSRIRVHRDGDVRALTSVRDNGQEAVQSRLHLSAPQTLVVAYARAMFASYLYVVRCVAYLVLPGATSGR